MLTSPREKRIGNPTRVGEGWGPPWCPSVISCRISLTHYLRSVAQLGRALALGARGCTFGSCHSDLAILKMEQIKKVDWTWEYGKVYYELTYKSNRSRNRKNTEPPPTKAAHDIAHFICGMNENLEWDYENEPNHIAEYNAVFVEQILGNFSHYYFHDCSIPMKENAKSIEDHLKWFAEEYYCIQIDHPSEKTHSELKKDFFDNIDIRTVVQHFMSFYQTWIIEESVGSQNFKITINMDSDIDYEFEPLYNYLIKTKQILIQETF